MNVTLLEQVELLKSHSSASLDKIQQSELAQYFTDSSIALFMASLFNSISGNVKLLDPGFGPGSLTAAFSNELISRATASSLEVHGVEVASSLTPYMNSTLDICEQAFKEHNICFKSKVIIEDFIGLFSNDNASGNLDDKYSHAILNPPYKKISSESHHRRILKSNGVDTVNLYSAFVMLSLKKLKPEGELVAILPRSFCNGPYYKSFRDYIFKHTSVEKLHIFDSRTSAFKADKVLQENIILHLIKGKPQGNVTVTSSPSSDFHYDEVSKSIIATDMTSRSVPFDSIVIPEDSQKIIHIAANSLDQSIIDKLSVFTTPIQELGIQVSTGPVVDFRVKDFLSYEPIKNTVPLIYPSNLNGGVIWPQRSKKPNSISLCDKTKGLVWANSGSYVVCKRFSSKEEKKRLKAAVLPQSLPGSYIGFDNKLNVYHNKKSGLDPILANGLYVYLNSTLLDKYYRVFGGHTQVNATDLRTINYPSEDTLIKLGSKVEITNLDQDEIDEILEQEIAEMTGVTDNNPLNIQNKVNIALDILKQLGLPRAQQNERSALTLLALLNLQPNDGFEDISTPLMGVTPIMDWCAEFYGKQYAPNTRETFRRQTLHQFLQAGIALYNPDDPSRPVNSPRACYQISPSIITLLKTYNTKDWNKGLSTWLSTQTKLVDQYAKRRKMAMVPLVLADGSTIKLSPGAHSQLISDIVTEFGPRFAPGSEVLYLGDTGQKNDYFKESRLKQLGVKLNQKGKLPDVVLFWPDKNWLLLIEAVTSHGPVDSKRHEELSNLFSSAKAGLVYVTAFPDRKAMTKYIGELSWETEVWISKDPTHMIHFNGDRFLGPHN